MLIPRPETEELVDWILKSNKNRQAEILDIGTGSGCISISLKHHLPLSKVEAIDISEETISIAKKNALENNVQVSFKKRETKIALRIRLNIFILFVWLSR